MDLEFFMHGVPKKGQEWWGKEDEIQYLESFYARSEKENGFLIELRRVGDKNYCYYSYLKYEDIVSSENRSGSYLGITVRFDVYCLDVIRLYRIFETLYKNYILGKFLGDDGRKYIVSGFEDSKVNFLYEQFKKIVVLTFQDKDFINIPQQQLIVTRSTYKINPNDYDCRTEQMIPEIQRLIFESAEIIISPSCPTLKENQIDTYYKQQIESITKAKETEINSLNDSLLKEKNHSATLSQQIGQLNTEKKNLQKAIDNLKKDNRNLETALSREISTKLDPIFENWKTEHTSSVKIGKNKLLPNRLISVIQFILILLTAILCVFHLLKE